MKNLLKILLGCACFLMFASCEKENKITFTFTLECSEELIEFVTPTATFIDANGEENIININESNFVKTDNSGLVGNDNPVMYTWSKQIFLKNVTTAQRDMRVSYKMRENAPQIDADKTYAMIHKLSGTYTKESGSSTTVDATVNAEVTIGEDPRKIEGSKLQNYLDNLIETPDYVIKTVK